MTRPERISLWPPAASVAILAVLVLWPGMLSPAARAVSRFCERLGIHHFLVAYCPPYLVAFLTVFVLVAAGVVLTILLRQIYGHQRLHRYMLSRRRQPDAATRDLLRKLRAGDRVLIFAGSERSAFCSGLLKPRAYVSTGLVDLLDCAELEAVLRHELHHVQRRDPLRLFLGRLLGVAGLLFPVLRVIDERNQVQIELAADGAALSAVPIEILASALVQVSRSQTRLTPMVVAPGFSATEARIAALLGEPVIPSHRRTEIAMSIAIASMLISISWWLTTLPLDHVQSCVACPMFS